MTNDEKEYKNKNANASGWLKANQKLASLAVYYYRLLLNPILKHKNLCRHFSFSLKVYVLEEDCSIWHNPKDPIWVKYCKIYEILMVGIFLDWGELSDFRFVQCWLLIEKQCLNRETGLDLQKERYYSK